MCYTFYQVDFEHLTKQNIVLDMLGAITWVHLLFDK